MIRLTNPFTGGGWNTPSGFNSDDDRIVVRRTGDLVARVTYSIGDGDGEEFGQIDQEFRADTATEMDAFLEPFLAQERAQQEEEDENDDDEDDDGDEEGGTEEDEAAPAAVSLTEAQLIMATNGPDKAVWVHYGPSNIYLRAAGLTVLQLKMVLSTWKNAPSGEGIPSNVRTRNTWPLGEDVPGDYVIRVGDTVNFLPPDVPGASHGHMGVFHSGQPQ